MGMILVYKWYKNNRVTNLRAVKVENLALKLWVGGFGGLIIYIWVKKGIYVMP